MTSLSRQFQCPTGRLGRLAGSIMYHWNSEMNELALELLEVQPGQRVAEIGSGPGWLLGRLTSAASPGLVIGIDPSAVMLEQARSHNREAVRKGQLALQRGTVSALPLADASIDRICTVNTIYFWPDPKADVAELYRVLQPAGRAVVTFRVRRRADGEYEVQQFESGRRFALSELKDLLRSAGFRDVDSQVSKLKRQAAAAIVAMK